MNKLEEINKRLQINNSVQNLIFIYTPSKVGSTSLVTSLRINLLPHYKIFHLHDEELLENSIKMKLGKIKIMDIIDYNQKLGKKIFVFDIYREPIEHRISLYFETLYDLHFNNTEENVKNYSLKLIIQRFHKIFPFLKMDDYFQKKFQIHFPNSFDFKKKYLLMEKNEVKYIKLRLKDSPYWNFILSSIFQQPIFCVRDYESKNKKIKNLFLSFYEIYKIPINYFHLIENDSSFLYYFNEKEQEEYLNKWKRKTSSLFFSFTTKEYQLYYTICLENKFYTNFQKDHYIDEGCICKKCNIQRAKVLFLIKNKQYKNEKIVH